MHIHLRSNKYQQMKTYDNADNSKRVWYDTHIRLWTLQTIDPEGNQTGECNYHSSRKFAMAWLTE